MRTRAREEGDERERQRVEALATYGILDSLPEEEFDDVARMAAAICETSVGAINFIDSNRQWTKAAHGFSLTELPREQSICGTAVLHPEALTVVPDARADRRFRNLHLVKEEGGIRFYAGAPIVMGDGHALGMVCAVDTTPRQLSEAQALALKALARQVATMLELRKANAELATARDEALAAVRAKNAFLTNMGHEFRTPMNGMLGMLSLLGSTQLDDRQRTFVRTLEESAQNLMGLLNEILEYADHSLGRSAIVRRETDLRQLGSEVEGLMRASAAKKGLNLVVRSDLPQGHRFDTDPMRLRQILIQLLDNAIKFTRAGSVELLIEQKPEGVRFKISDTGIGIASAQLQLVQEPFFQVDSSGRREQGGVGIGLSTAAELVRLLGSQIEIESEPGKGTTVSFLLPTHPKRPEGAERKPTESNRAVRDWLNRVA